MVQGVIERYLDHLQVEIIHTDKRDFRKALKEREKFLNLWFYMPPCHLSSQYPCRNLYNIYINS